MYKIDYYNDSKVEFLLKRVKGRNNWEIPLMRPSENEIMCQYVSSFQLSHLNYTLYEVLPSIQIPNTYKTFGYQEARDLLAGEGEVISQSIMAIISRHAELLK